MIKIGEYGFEPGVQASPFGEVSEFQNHNRFIVETVQLRKPSLHALNIAQHLSALEDLIPKQLITKQNFIEMKKLSSYFPEAISSFFGFESRLSSSEARADFLFAVSSMRNEREKLAELIRGKKIPEEFLRNREWQNICKFVLKWASPESILYQNVLGMWFEFDIEEKTPETPIPCIFLHTLPLRRTTKEIHWLTKTALPLAIGRKMPEKIEQNIIKAIQQLPPEALIMDAGVMLSRPVSGVRLIIAKIQPSDIIPYLRKIGWFEESSDLSGLLKDLEQQVTRIVLHITITEQGVEQKIGIECSFTSDRYHLETRWIPFFDFLVKKGCCVAEKKDALLQFIGIEKEDNNRDFDTSLYKPIVKIPDNNFSSAFVRYISHIKLVYELNHTIIAKAYPGVRLFGTPNTPPQESY